MAKPSFLSKPRIIVTAIKLSKKEGQNERMTPSPPSDGGEGQGEEERLYGESPLLDPLPTRPPVPHHRSGSLGDEEESKLNPMAVRTIPLSCRHFRFFLVVLLAGWTLPGISALPTLPRSFAVQMSPAEKGEWLIGELNCVACHAVEAGADSRLFSRLSPRLDQGGIRWTPQFLRAFLTGPAQAKPGTSMPNLMHGLPEQEREESVEALVHFLMSGRTPETAGLGANAYKMREGRQLYHSVGCVACHAPEESASALREGAEVNGAPIPASLQNDSIPLGPLAGKYTVETLTEFLMDPLQARPSGRMPSSNLTKSEASSIAMYLLRDQTNAPLARASKRVQGLAFTYFESGLGGTAELDSLTPVHAGMVERFSLEPRRRDQNIGFRYTGFLRVPRSGEYTFFLNSDDGSRLYIDDRQVVENDGTHAATERSGKMDLTAGDHPIMVVWFNAGGPFELKVSWRGPGLGKQEIPDSVLSYQGQPMVPLGQSDWVLDPAKARRGQELFAALNCVACHAAEGLDLSATFTGPPLRQLDPEAVRGCLGAEPSARAARFVLSDDQRYSIRIALQSSASWNEPLTADERVRKTMTALHCHACHTRGSEGGPSAERTAYFVTVGDEDLGDEGRLPPHLSGVGNKLKPEWLKKVLLEGASVRPYMATRMPRFGQDNVSHLVGDFAAADARDLVYGNQDAPLDDIKYGRALVGSGGLSCISCHTFGSYGSLGIPAMDLTQMAKRLQLDWFHRYLLDPPSLRPGTRMPSFWPEGKSLRDDLLDGDTHRQIDAIWAYLSRTEDAGVPPGLIQGKLELAAGNEARIYRAFINDSGVRGIGVALPEKANYTFDANELRPALIWQGPFIDAAKHRGGRGAGFEGPLGYNVVKMPPAPTFALFDSEASAWPRVVGKQAGFKMKGYRLDDERRPTFLYSFHDIDIEDTTIAVPGELEPSLVRTLKFKTARAVENLWHRAWVARSIEPQSGGTYLIDGKIVLKLRAAGGATPLLRESDGQTELLVPVAFQNREARLTEEIIW